MRRSGLSVKWLVVSVALVSLGGLVSTAAAGSRRVGQIGVGDSVFWQGDPVEAPEEEPITLPDLFGGQDEPTTGCDGDGCFEYRLEVVEPGAVLRVAIDTPDCSGGFEVELIAPDGTVAAQDSSCYSAELYVEDPDEGIWTARVTPTGSVESPFRMRAKLEPEPQPLGSKKRALLPNLRVEPPFDFGFGDEGRGLASSSCQEDEIVEDGARRCLRFAVGPQNVGLGPLELKFSRAGEVDTEAKMYQRVYLSDGSTKMRDAGSSEFHKTHHHFHLKGFASLDLYRVTDRDDGSMVVAGTGTKSGFCLVDFRIARWRSFDQQRAYTARSNCMPTGGKAALGLSAGWTDIYDANLPGNYVEFGNNPDGRYVVRVVVDSLGNILETRENDNVGYAYIEVAGRSVTLLERGQGTDPWDPDKVVFREWGSDR